MTDLKVILHQLQRRSAELQTLLSTSPSVRDYHHTTAKLAGLQIAIDLIAINLIPCKATLPSAAENEGRADQWARYMDLAFGKLRT